MKCIQMNRTSLRNYDHDNPRGNNICKKNATVHELKQRPLHV